MLKRRTEHRIVLATLLAPALIGAIAMTAPSSLAATYENPIIVNGNPADPHVIQVDDKYYLYATTHGRGYDVLVSTDLVNWEPKGSAFNDPRGGAWAPDVFHNVRGDGKFYLYYTDNDPAPRPGPHAKQIGVAVAGSPLGPFVDKKVLVHGAIDAHLYQDDDGQLYLYYVDLTDGFKIFAQRMNDPLTMEGERTLIIHPTEPWEMAAGQVTEGPFMLKRDGTYYMMYSGSGADSPQYAIGYATSKSPMGPFEKHPGNPIAARTAEIHGPGHHCVVTGPDGKLWMIYHQKWNDRVNWRRFIAIDPMWFNSDGVIETRLSRRVERPSPTAE